jgi:hypothetical protein
MFQYLIPAAAALIGGSMQSSAASNAAATQAAAADRAAALQKEMFEKQVSLQEPFRQAGMAGQNRLMELLGLRMPAQAGVGGAPAIRSEADLRNALLSQYTTPTRTEYRGREGDIPVTMGGEIDEAGLAAAIRNAQAKEQAALTAYQAQQAQQAQAAPSADFGKYARDFGMSDFQADPGYAFRLSEGQKALDRQAAARGGLISGAALKAAQRYGQDAASQEFTNAFNRYQTNRESQLNPLLSLAGRAQTASNTLGSAAGQYGTNVGNMYLGTGEAQGNAMMTGAQARGSAYKGISDIFSRSNALGSYFGGGGGSWSSPYEASAGVNFLAPNTYG